MSDQGLFVLPPLPRTSALAHVGQATGTAVEMRLIAELLDRGHKVAVPVVDDDGVDLIVDYSIVVQVKSTAQKKKAALVVRLDEQGQGMRDHVDVLAVYGREVRTWWLIPRAAIGSRNVVTVSGSTTLDVWRNAWHVFDVG